jgi:hypothetical protein
MDELQTWLAQEVELQKRRDGFKDLIDERCQWIEDRIRAGLYSRDETSMMKAAILALFEQWECEYLDWFRAAPENLSVEDVLALV